MSELLKRTLEALDIRMDDKYTAILARELEYVRAQTYDIVYPELRARQLIPVDGSVDPGAETISYDQWDLFGAAAVISNYADDLPLVDVAKERFSSVVQTLGDAYQWSIQDLQRAAMVPGARLSQRRAAAARQVVENKIEDIAAQGLPIGGLNGVLNHPNITLVAPDTGSWGTASGEQMVDDLNKLVDSVVVATEETMLPDSLILDTTSLRRLQNKKLVNSDMSALKWFKENNDVIKNIGTWYKTKTADAAGTGPRFLCYKKDPMVLQLVIPQEFQQLPAQARNLSFVVPCHARIGGVVVYYPMAMAYMDGCG